MSHTPAHLSATARRVLGEVSTNKKLSSVPGSAPLKSVELAASLGTTAAQQENVSPCRVHKKRAIEEVTDAEELDKGRKMRRASPPAGFGQSVEGFSSPPLNATIGLPHALQPSPRNRRTPHPASDDTEPDASQNTNATKASFSSLIDYDHDPKTGDRVSPTEEAEKRRSYFEPVEGAMNRGSSKERWRRSASRRSATPRQPAQLNRIDTDRIDPALEAAGTGTAALDGGQAGKPSVKMQASLLKARLLVAMYKVNTNQTRTPLQSLVVKRKPTNKPPTPTRKASPRKLKSPLRSPIRRPAPPPKTIQKTMQRDHITPWRLSIQPPSAEEPTPVDTAAVDLQRHQLDGAVDQTPSRLNVSMTSTVPDTIASGSSGRHMPSSPPMVGAHPDSDETIVVPSSPQR